MDDADDSEPTLEQAFARHRDRLRAMVKLRIDRRLRGRVDPSDVLQEAYLDLAERWPAYAKADNMPLFVWLRLVVVERLLRIHRHHLGTAMRDPGREVALHAEGPPARSDALAARLLGRFTTASRAAARAELRVRLLEALERMDPIDREVIALRHFEELSNDETAAVLGLSKAAASKRYVRALVRLKAIADTTPGLRDDESG